MDVLFSLFARTDKTDMKSDKKWYCESCPEFFTSVEELKEHEAIHDADKPFICILCKKDFVLKSSLSRHIQTLHGVDPCPIVESDKCLKKIVSQNWNESVDLDYEGKSSEFPLSPEVYFNCLSHLTVSFLRRDCSLSCQCWCCFLKC